MRDARTEIAAMRYCLMVLATGLTLVATIAGFNALVDPFGMYRSLEIEGFNVYKPTVFNRVRLYKAFELRRIRPQAVILGTSRSHLGISCSHEAWSRLDGPCYNLAFDGATTREMYQYLVHAHAIRPLRHVVLGLDAYHAVPTTSFTRPDFDPLILRDASAPAWWRLLTGDLRLLASLDTLRAAIDTLRSQVSPEPSWFAPDGQRLGEVFFRRPGEDFVIHGPRAYFDEIDRLEVGFQTEGAAPRSGHASAEPSPVINGEESSLAYIRRIVDFCRKEGIDLRIFITPSHAHQSEIAAATGAWPAIEEGKRALVRLLADDLTRHPTRAPIQLIDFSGYSSITTEPLPPVGSREEMRYYWDSSHFKANVGGLVLDRLFGLTQASRAAPLDFGMPLTGESMEAVLAQQRVAQSAYRERVAPEIAQLRSLVQLRLDIKAVEPVMSAGTPVR
jgi:hypothetical protein